MRHLTSKIEHQSIWPILVSKEAFGPQQLDLLILFVHFSFIFSENPLYNIGPLREHFPVALSLKILYAWTDNTTP